MSPTFPAISADETFDGTWSFRARYTDAPGFRMHYVERFVGRRSRPPVLWTPNIFSVRILHVRRSTLGRKEPPSEKMIFVYGWV